MVVQITGGLDALIIGNGVAGYACAKNLARRGLRPALVGPGLPFDRPPLSKDALAAGAATPRADAAALERDGIVHVDGLAVAADLDASRVTVATTAGETELTAPAIVVAVGLSYEPVPIAGLSDAHVNATPEGFSRVAPLLAPGVRRVVIVGAGLIGVETAATLAAAGHDVTIVDVEPRPLQRLHDPLPEIASATLDLLGVRFAGDATIHGVHHGEDGRATIEGSAGALEADVVIAATGARQRQLDWLGPLPLEVDPGMRVPGHHGLFAIGDCCVPAHARFGPLRLPHWDVALGTADAAAAAIAGEDGAYDRLPYWWTDIGPLRVAEVGCAQLAVEWTDDGELYVGRGEEGDVVCCTVINNPRRLREARELLVSAAVTP
jgi:3-phenylpropionate/trans-cinnamate dioxygenase ferredoxin reductase subunit